jgi:hypothetical protein
MIKTSNIIKELPYSGISSACLVNQVLIMGSAERGDLIKYNGSNLISAVQTGESFPINNLLNVDDTNIIASCGGKLFMGFGASNSTGGMSTLVVADFGDDEFITDIIKATDSETIIISTTNGRILSCGTEIIRAYLTGQRTIYANVLDGFENESNTFSTDVTYALYKKIAEVNPNKVIEKWKFASPTSAIVTEKINGVFISPIMHIKEDFGFWKELIWQEEKPSDTDIVISLRASTSYDDLLSKKWQYSFKSNSGEDGTITRYLNNIALSGQYIQVKVDMFTNKNSVSPVVSTITLKYSTKQASYFFTTKFSLGQETNGSDNGIMVAKITEPLNTEVKFGISNKESSNWEDYTVIEPEKIFNVENMSNVKVGIKFISYDESIPEVAEFSMLLGSESKKILGT